MVTLLKSSNVSLVEFPVSVQRGRYKFPSQSEMRVSLRSASNV